MNFIYAGINLNQSLPIISEDKTEMIFSMSVTTHIEGAPKDKFQQVDNVNFSIPVANLNPLTVNDEAEKAAKEFILQTYPNT